MAHLSAGKLVFVVSLNSLISFFRCQQSIDVDEESVVSSSRQFLQQRFTVEGKISVSDDKLRGDWISETKVLVNGGDHIGFVKSDGTFSINFVPSGSHLIEVFSPNYIFEKVRVDITRGGKFRARKANFIQPNTVHVVPYPLRLHVIGQAPFFETRETWKVTDIIFNPMVIMMVLPLLFLFLMPKLLANADPDTQKEMQSSMNVFQNQQQMPEISDLFAKWFSHPKKRVNSEKSSGIKSGRRN